MNRQPNVIQKAIAWMLQKAVGFPAWNLASQAPGAYRDFFRGMGPVDAMQRLAWVYNCNNLLCRRVSTLPVDVVQSDGKISVPVPSRIADLLVQPNEYMNQVVFLEAMILSLGLRGNSYNEIVRIGNQITALWPLNPDRVLPQWDGANLNYKVSLPDGRQIIKEPRDIWHVRNFSFDGINGMTPLSLYAVRKAIAAGEMYDKFVRNGIRPSIVVKSPLNPKKEEKEEAAQIFAKLYAGEDNVGKALFAWGGSEIIPLSIDPVDAQLLESMKMDLADIAAAYGVPLNLLNQTDKTATYASAEQFNRYFVDYTLDPLCTRISLSATENLLNPRLGQKVKFNLDALLQGDAKTKFEVLGVAVDKGLMTLNEARAKINLPPVDGGDKPRAQTNMTTIDQLGKQPTPATEPPQPPPTKSRISDWNSLTEAVSEVGWKASMQ